MILQEQIFNKIKSLLKDKFNERINESDNGMHLSIDKSGIFIEFINNEIILGFDFIHYHYESPDNRLMKGIDSFFNLLTKRKRQSLYYKGNTPFKRKIEIELSESEYELYGIEAIWLFPYWKKTTREISFIDKLIDSSAIENELIEIKNCAQQPV